MSASAGFFYCAGILARWNLSSLETFKRHARRCFSRQWNLYGGMVVPPTTIQPPLLLKNNCLFDDEKILSVCVTTSIIDMLFGRTYDFRLFQKDAATRQALQGSSPSVTMAVKPVACCHDMFPAP